MLGEFDEHYSHGESNRLNDDHYWKDFYLLMLLKVFLPVKLQHRMMLLFLYIHTDSEKDTDCHQFVKPLPSTLCNVNRILPLCERILSILAATKM